MPVVCASARVFELQASGCLETLDLWRGVETELLSGFKGIAA